VIQLPEDYMAQIKDNSPTPLFRCWIFFMSMCFLDPLFKTKIHETPGKHYSGMIGHQYKKKLPKLNFFDPFFGTSIWGVWDFPCFLKKGQFYSKNRDMNKMTRNSIFMSFTKFSSRGIQNTPIFLLYPHFSVLKWSSKLSYFVNLPKFIVSPQKYKKGHLWRPF